MKLFQLIFPVLVLAASAIAQDVKYNFDEKADFAKYKTYRWAKSPQSADLDDLTTRQLMEAFDAELAKKGLKRVDADSADLVIVYEVAFKSEKQLTSFDTGWGGYGPGWRAGWGGGMGGMSTATTSTIPIGALDLDMYDAADKHVVWRCMATKTLDPKANPDKQKKNMAKGAEKILKNYPPKIKK
jgi:hypothetical protein